MNTDKLNELLANLETAISELRSYITSGSDLTPDLTKDSNKINSVLLEAKEIGSEENKTKADKPSDNINDSQDEENNQEIQSATNRKVVSAKIPKNTLASSLPENMLGEVPNFKSKEWPEAIDKDMIISDDDLSEQKFRALQIVNHIPVSSQGLKVLDFGCGNGLTASEYASLADLAVGYDIQVHDIWSECKEDNLILTTDYDEVIKNGPYDLIVMFDVMDHIVGEDPSTIMRMVASLLSDAGTIFVRTHPWSSRTGGHIYNQHNKAFLHLALTPNEMAKYDIDIEPNLKLVRPMAVYESWFSKNNLKIANKKAKTSPIDPFFNNEIMDRIIKINWGGKVDVDTAKKIMSNHFIDYQLQHIDSDN